MLYETMATFGLACAHCAVRYTIRGGRAIYGTQNQDPSLNFVVNGFKGWKKTQRLRRVWRDCRVLPLRIRF